MDAHTISHASTLLARSDSSAVASGVFIGISFVLKKIGLLKANVKYNEEAGEGYGYLKNFWWWTGMTLMIVGEICNFVAYAFVDAILVTPLGALSVVITTILSAIFLKERLSFVGKVGCFSCIIGSVVIAMNAPEQSSVSNIQEMQHFVITPGFLSYAGVILLGSFIVAIWVAPRYAKKSMFVYISICSLVGGLSVVATQGLGSAILAQINGESQFKQWFLYVLFVFVVGTLLTEIIYLNKALNIFNAALVTPTYYVMFTTATIVTSAVLFQGFKGTGTQIATVVMGFFQICSGVVLLQLSKSAKDVPDAAVFKGDLDQIREVATQEEPEYEPKADSIRGAASIIRRISTTRRTAEADEARRYVHDKQEDFLRPPNENEIIEWDGIRRRKTVVGEGPTMSRPITPRSPSIKQHLPPLGMSRFPDPEPEDDDEHRPTTKQSGRSFFSDVRSRASSVLHPNWIPLNEQNDKSISGGVDTEYHGADHGLEAPPRFIGRDRSDTPRSIHWADKESETELSENTARRQFSFNNMFNRMRGGSHDQPSKRSGSPPRGILRRSNLVPDLRSSATEEENLGLVKGDSRAAHPEESLGEKLERWSSSESEANEAKPMHPRSFPQPQLSPVPPMPAGRPHGDSVSSMSTAAFPPYEDHHAFYSQGNASNPYYLPPSYHASISPERMDEHEGWQLPGGGTRTRTRTNSSSHRAPPPSQSSFSTHRHPNPLPLFQIEKSQPQPAATPLS
ncbi:Magnesium transporter NIPA [Penicillium argentinense]|uniref:Magnesium transporter NIPA n=1 Tax=Penicillium argentinense TaxID=1131581 RepID=A0A9W9KDX1_9EURO|nr:Magnesium transporter NIPA [Penicillium argentinense]KAJ5102930.1 Magnesium transporter NIPA [Penicillium argentinense]